MNYESTLEPYLPDLKKYCFSLAGTPWDGEDLYQDTLVKIMDKSPNTFSDHPNPKGYLFKVASNHWRDTLRKRGREDLEYGDQDIPLLDISLIDSIEILVSYLPFKQATTILLTEYYGFSAKEVAETLDMTVGAVKAALNRGRTTLQQMRDSSYKSKDAVEILLKRLLSAIRNDEFNIIISTYHILVSHGVKVMKTDKYFSFEIDDPDGNRYLINEKI